MPPGARGASGVTHHHRFNSLGIPQDFTDPVIVGGSNLGSIADGLHIVNTGGETAGVSYIRSRLHYGRQSQFNIIADMPSGSSPAHGGHAELFLELYQDEDNWVRFGPYRDTSEGINSLAYLRWCIGGTLGSISLSTDVLNTDPHAYSIITSEASIGFYMDYVLLFSLPTISAFTRFRVGIGGGTESNTDQIDARVSIYTLVESGDPTALDLLFAISSGGGIGGGSPSAQTRVELCDFFNDLSIDNTIWGAPTQGGSTTVVEGSGSLKIANPGSGTAGYGVLRTTRSFSGVGHFSVDFKSISRTLAADSTLRQSICIYIDANNWVKWGLIDKKDAPTNNALGFLEYSIGGTVSSLTLISAAIDSVPRTYSIDVISGKARFAVDGIYYGELTFPDIDQNYTCQIEAGSNKNTDNFECLFDDWVYRNWTDLFQLASAGAIHTCLNNIEVLLDRFTSARAGYLDVIPDLDNIDTYLGTDRITGNDGAQAVALPQDTNVVVLTAEGGAVRYELNGTATATSAGVVPQNATVILAVSNLSSLSVWAATGAYANCVCYQRG